MIWGELCCGVGEYINGGVVDMLSGVVNMLIKNGVVDMLIKSGVVDMLMQFVHML